MVQIKEKLIVRLSKVIEDIQSLQVELGNSLKSFSTPDKSKIASASTIHKKLEVKGYEFSIICNILIEEFNIDFNTEVPETIKNMYFGSIKIIGELKKQGNDIPEELQKLLETKK